MNEFGPGVHVSVVQNKEDCPKASQQQFLSAGGYGNLLLSCVSYCTQYPLPLGLSWSGWCPCCLVWGFSWRWFQKVFTPN